MADWAPVVVAVVLFALLSPGLLFELPGNGRAIEFGTFKTNGKAIAVHAFIFFVISSIIILALHLHIYAGFSGTILDSFIHNSSSQALSLVPKLKERNKRREKESGEMADWGPVVIAVVLFVLLTPGLLFQLPGNGRVVEFANFQTSGISILVHTIIYFGLITIFLIAIGVHIYTG
ncbi:hypothetical protein J5N97_007183 [Dioscorea zingiberensis]|uniref:Transmembrane protein n=1 Tax=Dioscorea zingiberensis TaxID=325984 RepID=A0A9D5DEA2_9LILI|nr:hypothetical protein J5N97_007183 [Dioscorea zingiberensis]